MAYINQQPAYGLSGANSILNRALSYNSQRPNYGATEFSPDYGQVNANRDMAIGQGTQGIQSVQGYAQQGQQANQRQAALSGALGPQAQQQAYSTFQSSPGQQWLQDQALRGVTRNAAALGGLGGGNVRQELQRQAMGLAQQDYQNQFNNLGAVGDRGMQAAQLQNALYQSNANAATSAGAQGAGLQSSGIGANASLRNALTNANSGWDTARLGYDTSLFKDQAGYAMGAGENIANNLNLTTSALSQLANQQGAGLSDMYGGYVGNIANLLAGAGGQQAQSNQALASLLANISSNSANQYSSLPGIPGIQQTTGILEGIGKALGGAGSLIAASDRRLKTNIRRAGSTTGGNALYSWDWNREGKRIAGNQIPFGVIAQEVNQDAVIVGADGYLRVDYMRVL